MLNSLVLPSSQPPQFEKSTGKKKFNLPSNSNPIAPLLLSPPTFPKGPIHDRWPRVAENHRNFSSLVFQWKHYPQDVSDQGPKSLLVHSSEAMEQKRRIVERQKREEFWNARRERREQMENLRWGLLKQKENAEKETLSRLRERSRFGESSVGYNLINSYYLENNRGEKQRSLDNLALKKFERRENNIFLKQNAFDPIQHQRAKTPIELAILPTKDRGIRIVSKSAVSI